MTIEDNMEFLKSWMPKEQWYIYNSLIKRSEEKSHFIAKAEEMVGIIKNMPKTYETETQGNKAIIRLHYFIGGWDWFIIEKDKLENQHQAFGLVRGCETELGYINIPEILKCKAELDLFWKPVTVSQILGLEE